MTVVGFRLSQLQVHLGTEQGKDEGATLRPAFLGAKCLTGARIWDPPKPMAPREAAHLTSTSPAI